MIYETAGDGPPILFLHGLGMGRQVWTPIVQALQHQFRCIRLDMVGFGEHTPPQELKLIAFETWVNQIQEVIQTLSLTKIHLVGHSLGSLVALAFAAQHPSHALSVTAISTFPEFGPALTDAFEQRARKVEQAGMAGVINDMIQSGFSAEMRKNQPEIIETYRQIVSQNTSFQYALACRSVANVSIRPLLHQVTAPVQTIVGLNDKVIPPSLSESVCEMVRECKRYTALKDCGHQILLEKPVEVAKIIFDFLHKNFGRNDK